MPTFAWNQEWPDVNSQRRLPLASDATARDQSDSFEIPNDFIVELDLPVAAGVDVDPGKFYVKHIGAYATGYSVIIGYDSDDGPIDVATALIARQTHTRNRLYALGGIAPFDDTLGKITIGRLETIDEQPPGFYTFDLEATRLDPDAVRPMIRGVSAIILVNGDQRSPPLRGDIELVAGANMQLVPILVDGEDPVIRFNAITGAGLTEDCVCEGDAADLTPITSINGILPTPDGRFTFLGSECIDIVGVTNGVQIVDTCSKPCCGCPELEKITEDLARLNDEAGAVTQFVNQLGASIGSFNAIVLGAKLRDRGCLECA